MAEEEDIARFIRSTIASIWTLELLLLLRRHRRSWTGHEAVAVLRASDLIVSQGVTTLAAAGLVIVDHAGSFTYRPASKADDSLVAGAEVLYARSPDAVRRLIVGSANGLAAFADAFKLRRS